MLETAQKIIDEDGDLKIINEFDEKLLKKVDFLLTNQNYMYAMLMKKALIQEISILRIL